MDRVSGILCVVKRALVVEGFGCLEVYSCTGGDMCVGFRHFRVSLVCVTLKYWLYMCGKAYFSIANASHGPHCGGPVKITSFLYLHYQKSINQLSTYLFISLNLYQIQPNNSYWICCTSPFVRCSDPRRSH